MAILFGFGFCQYLKLTKLMDMGFIIIIIVLPFCSEIILKCYSGLFYLALGVFTINLDSFAENIFVKSRRIYRTSNIHIVFISFIHIVYVLATFREMLHYIQIERRIYEMFLFQPMKIGINWCKCYPDDHRNNLHFPLT